MSDYGRLKDYLQAARDCLEDADVFWDGVADISELSRQGLVRDLVQLELEAKALRERIRENHAQVPAGDREPRGNQDQRAAGADD